MVASTGHTGCLPAGTHPRAGFISAVKCTVQWVWKLLLERKWYSMWCTYQCDAFARRKQHRQLLTRAQTQCLVRQALFSMLILSDGLSHSLLPLKAPRHSQHFSPVLLWHFHKQKLRRTSQTPARCRSHPGLSPWRRRCPPVRGCLEGGGTMWGKAKRGKGKG